jgi:hypothetical protein
MLFEKIELESGESVLKVVRKHWFIITAELVSIAVAAIMPLMLVTILALIPDFLPETLHLDTHLPIILFGAAAWLLLTVIVMSMIWTHYYLDLWIVTDRRIIVIDQIHFFNRKVSSFRLERLQDIKVAVDGVLATFLNFGTIRAQTASAAESSFKTTGLPEPRELQSLIQKATDERLKSLHGAAAQAIID